MLTLSPLPEKEEHPPKSVLKKSVVRVRDCYGAHPCPTSASWRVVQSHQSDYRRLHGIAEFMDPITHQGGRFSGL